MPACFSGCAIPFNEGYQPHLISLTATARSLRRRGVFADLVRHETRVSLHAGRWPRTGRAGDPWPVSIGPWLNVRQRGIRHHRYRRHHRTSHRSRPASARKPNRSTHLDALAHDYVRSGACRRSARGRDAFTASGAGQARWLGPGPCARRAREHLGLRPEIFSSLVPCRPAVPGRPGAWGPARGRRREDPSSWCAASPGRHLDSLPHRT